MKILLVHRYFWPDTPPYASILRTIAEHLATEGHDMHVLTAQPSYGGSDRHKKAARLEELNDVTVKRVPLIRESKTQPIRRGINLGLFAIQVFFAVLRGDFDTVMAATTPPVFVALAARLAARLRGATFVYHMQDIYPEVLAANSGHQLNFGLRLLRRIDALNTRHADRVVVLSTDMQSSLSQRGHAVEHTHIINNFVPDASHAPTSSPTVISPTIPDSFQVVFAGNLGNFQGLDEVIDAFHLLSERDVCAHLVLVGDGAAELDLRERAGALLDTTVFFNGRVSQGQAEEIIGVSDLALVTLNPGVIGTAFPSKTMTYLTSGTSVLAAVEEDSELATVLRESGAGASCALDAESLAHGIAQAAALPNSHPEKVKKFSESYASPAARLPQWSELFGNLNG